jgi:RNA polymerase sigma-70 factor, ECF subfamily
MEEIAHRSRPTRVMGARWSDETGLDAAVLDGLRREEPGAQERFFELYRDRVYSIALHYLRGDQAGAMDVTQEVFVKAFRAMPKFRGDARLATWLYRIVSNACTDEIRRRRRMLPFGDLPLSLHPHVTDDTQSDGELVAAVERLSPKLRLAVLLRYYDDLSYDEMATALGCSAGTVASRLSRAHAALARELAHLRPMDSEHRGRGDTADKHAT